jgi:hypothetical protein
MIDLDAVVEGVDADGSGLIAARTANKSDDQRCLMGSWMIMVYMD